MTQRILLDRWSHSAGFVVEAVNWRDFFVDNGKEADVLIYIRAFFQHAGLLSEWVSQA